MTETRYEHRQFRCLIHDLYHQPGQRGHECEGEWALRPQAEAAINAAIADGSIWGGDDAPASASDQWTVTAPDGTTLLVTLWPAEDDQPVALEVAARDGHRWGPPLPIEKVQ